MHAAARSLALLAAVLLAALLLAAAIVRLPPIQRWAAAQVSARLPQGASIGRAGLTLVPPGVQLTDVSLAADGPMIASVSCHVRLAALLAGRVEVAAVVVDGARLDIERTATGGIRIAGPLAGVLGSVSTSPDQAAVTEATPGFSLAQLPSVTIDNGELTFVDQAGHGGVQTLRLDAVRLTLGEAVGGAVDFTVAARLDPAGQISAHGSARDVAAPNGGATDRAVDLALTAKQLDANTVVSYLAAIVPGGGIARAQGAMDGSLTLSGSLATGFSGDATIKQPTGSLLWDEVSFGAPLTLAAHIVTSAADVALSDGQLKIANLVAARVAAGDIDAAFDVAHGTLNLTSATASAYGGTWSQSGLVTLDEPPHFDIRLRAEGIGCVELLTAVTGEHPEYGCELFNAEAALRGQWNGAETVAQNAQGTGRVEMRGGTIPSSSIIGAMWQAIVPRVAVRATPIRFGAPTRVDHLTESFVLRDGRMTTNDLSLVTDDYTVTGTGSIGLDGRLDLDTNVALTPEGVTKLLLMASLPVPDEVPDLPAVPTDITGTVGSPTILPAVSAIPSAAIRGLFRGVVGAGELVTDKADKGLRGLVGGLERAGRSLTDR
jgi:uncharacterized protein involved in outer membrane biogenesis